ncbi:MAG: serine/threonine-protein kinase [Sumerlaeia bacterium]
MSAEPPHSSTDDPTASMPTPPSRGTASPTQETVLLRGDDVQTTPAFEGHIPRQFGQFKVLRQIGKGGMGLVLEAFDTELERSVALKIISPEIARIPEFVERLREEARSAARLSHGSIASVYAMGTEGNLPYIAMEFLVGEDVSQRIKRSGPMTADRSLEITIAAAQALAHAAKSNIVHRDIKPANMFLCEDGRIKVMDFGIAKRLDMDAQLTSTGAILGTPAYMAPEQASEGRADFRADMYSLGCSLYSMMAGHAPFTGKVPTQVLISHATEPLPIPKRWNALAGGKFVEVLNRMTAKAPKDRYTSWEECISALQTVRAALGNVGSLTSATAVPRQGRRGKLPWLWIGGGVAALGLIGLVLAGVMVFMGGGSGRSSSRSAPVEPISSRPGGLDLAAEPEPARSAFDFEGQPDEAGESVAGLPGAEPPARDFPRSRETEAGSGATAVSTLARAGKWQELERAVRDVPIPGPANVSAPMVIEIAKEFDGRFRQWRLENGISPDTDLSEAARRYVLENNASITAEEKGRIVIWAIVMDIDGAFDLEKNWRPDIPKPRGPRGGNLPSPVIGGAFSLYGGYVDESGQFIRNVRPPRPR